MRTVENGVIQQLSTSRVETFDHEQKGGCELRFWFETVHGLKPEESTKGQGDGVIGHDRLADYFTTGNPPLGRVKMGKPVRAAIVKGELPAPGHDLYVEERLNSQRKFETVETAPGVTEERWLELDASTAPRIAGVPFDGFIDLAFLSGAKPWQRGDIPTVWDHKWSASPEEYALDADKLIRTVQMPVYVFSRLKRWDGAPRWRIVHGHFSRSGCRSFLRDAIVTPAQVLQRVAEIADLVERMKVVARAPRQDDVRFNRRSCDTWMGCPHQSICNPYRRNMFTTDASEEALFSAVDAASTPAQPPADPPRKRLQIVDVDPPVDEAKVAAIVDLTGCTVEEARTQLVAKARKAAEAEAAKAKAEAERVAAEKAKTEADAKAAAEKAKADEEAKAQSSAGPAPAASAETKPAEPPTCPACGVALDETNGSKLQSGLWAHVGCPKNAAAPQAGETKPEKKGKAPKAAATATPDGVHVVRIEVGPETRALILDLIGALAKRA